MSNLPDNHITRVVLETHGLGGDYMELLAETERILWRKLEFHSVGAPDNDRHGQLKRWTKMMNRYVVGKPGYSRL